MSLETSVSRGRAEPGQEFTISIKVFSSSETERTIQVRTILADSLEAVRASTSGGACTIGDTVSCDLRARRGHAASITIGARVRPNMAAGVQATIQALAQDDQSHTAASDRIVVEVLAPASSPQLPARPVEPTPPLGRPPVEIAPQPEIARPSGDSAAFDQAPPPANIVPLPTPEPAVLARPDEPGMTLHDPATKASSEHKQPAGSRQSPASNERPGLASDVAVQRPPAEQPAAAPAEAGPDPQGLFGVPVAPAAPPASNERPGLASDVAVQRPPAAAPAEAGPEPQGLFGAPAAPAAPPAAAPPAEPPAEAGPEPQGLFGAPAAPAAPPAAAPPAEPPAAAPAEAGPDPQGLFGAPVAPAAPPGTPESLPRDQVAGTQTRDLLIQNPKPIIQNPTAQPAVGARPGRQATRLPNTAVAAPAIGLVAGLLGIALTVRSVRRVRRVSLVLGAQLPAQEFTGLLVRAMLLQRSIVSSTALMDAQSRKMLDQLKHLGEG